MSRTIESVVGYYSRIAPTQRGGYRLARLARRFRPKERWAARYHTPLGPLLDLDIGTYPDCCMAYGLYELTTVRLIRRMLSPGDHFVDAGANIGYFTLLASRCVGPDGRVDAIEPQPDNHARLAANVVNNGSPAQVRRHALALADRTGQTSIHAYPESDVQHNHGCASMFPEPAFATRATTVPTVRLDELLADTDPTLIKLDVEGAELLAIEGMAQLLHARRPPTLVVEYNRSQAHLAGVEPEAWVRRTIEIQPAYSVHVIGRRLRPIDPHSDQLAALDQANLLLRCP